MRVYLTLIPLTLIPMWLLLATPATADTFGVSLSSSGSAGDACQLTPQIAAEGFNSGNLTGSYSLSYSGSAVGYDNSYPNSPTDATATGCVYSPVFANVAADGIAALGVLKASASADMTGPLVSANARIGEGWNDMFTSVSGGTYLLTFNLNVTDSATPACPGGNPLTGLTYNNNVLASGFQAIANWNFNDCSSSTAPTELYGGATSPNSKTAQIVVSVGAGGTFTVSSSLGISAGAGDGQSSFVNASDTAYLDIVGENGATYTAASGITYDFTDSGTPEPGSWLLIGCGIAALWIRIRGLSARRRGAA